ncbi:hypothetical protein CSUI_002398 [Cystoisospora suis]|uniref:Uncharacterized protein n=1 Tax=Cystoisospora suis TaxID=483139 RepID=A0A2C6KI88_9APIC|nr:hypothetical protein CSUI_002398 [Cystoisospora suis]
MPSYLKRSECPFFSIRITKEERRDSLHLHARPSSSCANMHSVQCSSVPWSSTNRSSFFLFSPSFVFSASAPRFVSRLTLATHVLTSPVRPAKLPRFQWSQRRGAKLLRWTPDTAVAHRLETLVEAKDFLLACKTWEDQMTRRDYLAALTLLTTRKRLDTRDSLFLRFVDRVLSHPSLTDSAHIHLVMHRFAVLGYAPPLWRLASATHSFLSKMQPAQLSLVAWALATSYVLDNRLWNEMGRLVLLHIPDFSFTDVAMVAWAFSRMDRRNPVELMALKKRAIEFLDALNDERREDATHALSNSSSRSAPARRLSCSASSSAVPSLSSFSSLDSRALVPPHDLCMLFRAFATLTPRDLSLHLRLFHTIVTTSCAPPAEVSHSVPLPDPSRGPARQSTDVRGSSEISGMPATEQPHESSQDNTQTDTSTSRIGVSDSREEELHAETSVQPTEIADSCTSGSQARCLKGEGQPWPRGVETQSIWRKPATAPFSLTAQALTAVWTALADINFLGHFPLPGTNKATVSSSVRGASPLSRSSSSSLAVLSSASSSSPVSSPVSFPTFSSLFETPKRSSPRGAGLQVSSEGVRWMLERLCEETRLLRLDHTINTNMVTKLAEAMLKLNFVDPRVVYQLIHFTQKRGGEQLQPEQVLTLAKVFYALKIFDEKAWKKLAHRAQATAVDLSAKEVRELLFYFRKAGVSNQRVEGCLDHFVHLKEDIDKYGPI